MLRIFNLISIVIALLWGVKKGHAQTIDTSIIIDSHRIHFNIFKDSGIPILFESGAGDDATVWDSIIKPIAELTNATIIMYDRAGFGKSTIDTVSASNSDNWILDGLKDLEIGLEALGYNKDIILVSHSYGGYLSSLYANKYPDRVKSIILIDVSHNFHAKTAKKEAKKHAKEVNALSNSNPGFYFLATNYPKTAHYMSTISFPKDIPIIDLVHEISFMNSKRKSNYWQKCHQDFSNNHPNSKAIIAKGCGHYIWHDNPCLIIKTIAEAFAELTNEINKKIIHRKISDFTDSENICKKDS